MRFIRKLNLALLLGHPVLYYIIFTVRLLHVSATLVTILRQCITKDITQTFEPLHKRKVLCV